MKLKNVATSQNRLLARLPPADRARFVRACALVELKFGDTVAHAGRKIAHVYLPTSGYLSIIKPIDADQIEVALAGSEGMFGWSLALESEASEVRALVQGAGGALRLSSSAFKHQMGL